MSRKTARMLRSPQTWKRQVGEAEPASQVMSPDSQPTNAQPGFGGVARSSTIQPQPYPVALQCAPTTLLGVLALDQQATRCASCLGHRARALHAVPTPMVYAPAAGTPSASAPSVARVPVTTFQLLRATCCLPDPW